MKEVEHEFSAVISVYTANYNFELDVDQVGLPTKLVYHNDIQSIQHIDTSTKGLTYHLTLDVDPCVL